VPQDSVDGTNDVVTKEPLTANGNEQENEEELEQGSEGTYASTSLSKPLNKWNSYIY
jgi:hypothetical protein